MGGISGEIASIVLFFNPIPLLPSPLKGEERSYLAFMRLPCITNAYYVRAWAGKVKSATI